MPEDPGQGLATLPEIPAELGLDPVLAALLHCAAFLDLSADDVVDAEAATEVLEHVGLYIQQLSPERQEQVGEQLERLRQHAEKAGWSDDAIDFVDDFLYSCGIGEDIDED